MEKAHSSEKIKPNDIPELIQNGRGAQKKFLHFRVRTFFA